MDKQEDGDANYGNCKSLCIIILLQANVVTGAPQKGIYSIIGVDDPKGWRHQLVNEPIAKVELQRIWSLYRNENNRSRFELTSDREKYGAISVTYRH